MKLFKRYLLLLFLSACGEQDQSNTDQLKSTLVFLQQKRDSLERLQHLKQENIFELEIEKTTDSLITDSSYQSLKENINQLHQDLKQLDQEIENTQSAIYRPR